MRAIIVLCSSATLLGCVPQRGGEGDVESALATSAPIVSAIGSRCLDDNGDKTANGNKIQLYACNGTAAQKWTYENETLVGPGGKCLDIQSDNQVNGTIVQLYQCNGTIAQKWAVSGTTIKSTKGLCLDVEGGVNGNGTQVNVATCNGSASQSWHVGSTTESSPDAAMPPKVDAGTAPDLATAPPPTTGGLHVKRGTGGAAGHIVDSNGATVTLHGADRSGTEYSCLYGELSDGPSDQATVTAMKAWNINAVRVPMNEDCWLGINGVPAASGGANYQAGIRSWVSLLEQNGMYVILDLHWAAPGIVQANGQLGMADSDHAPTFWSQVAKAYAGDASHVIFDLFNEPFITDWNCWMKGGACAVDYNNNSYTVAGMATLLQSVRNAGADNVVMMGGLGYASDFTNWLAEVDSIPTLAAPLNGLSNADIAVSWHAYSDQSVETDCPTEYNGYSTSLSCVNGATTAANYGITPLLAAGFPFVAGEVGIEVYSSNIAPYSATQAGQLETWLESLLTWADSEGQSYIGWNWNTDAPPELLSNFDGTPSPYFGVTYKAHLAKF